MPKSKELSYRQVFRKPVILDTSSEQIEVPLPSDKMSLGDFLLGASSSLEICLRGYDEIGREITEKIATFINSLPFKINLTPQIKLSNIITILSVYFYHFYFRIVFN